MARTQEQKDSDRKVKRWMKDNPEVVEKVGRRRVELGFLSTPELAGTAELKFGIDVSKIREKLIVEIIAAEGRS